MPELPDILAYIDALQPRIVGKQLLRVRVASPFLVRSVDPPLTAVVGRVVRELRRLGKRIVLGLEGDLFVIVHLMIAGRFRWADTAGRIPGRIGLAAFDFPNGSLLLTEASTQKRASLHVVQGEAALAEHSRGGLEVLDADEDAFRGVIRSENHTLKRALTDPRLFSGIGNAYSDEILHAAGLSPVQLTQKLTDEEISRLYASTRSTLQHWIEVLRAEFRQRFPGAGDVTAFREDFAVHGRYRQPCRVCGAPVQRIRYAENETNYCAKCQTQGRLLADRGLSRLLKDDWPRSLEELEAQRSARRVEPAAEAPVTARRARGGRR